MFFFDQHKSRTTLEVLGNWKFFDGPQIHL